MRDAIRNTVIRVIQSQTGLDISNLDFDGDIRQQIDLDSMQYLAVSVALERALNMKLPIEVMLARTFNDLFGIIVAEAEKQRCPAR